MKVFIYQTNQKRELTVKKLFSRFEDIATNFVFDKF